MDIIIEAKYIPDGTEVYKKTGQTKFVLRDSLKIYTYGKKGGNLLDVIKSDEVDVRYMIDGRGNVNMVSGDTKLRISLNSFCEEEEFVLQDLLRNKYNLDLRFDYIKTPQ